MSGTRLGYVKRHAGEVVSLATAELDHIRKTREEKAEEFIKQFMEPRTGLSALFYGKGSMTREEALKYIENDEWLRHEFWYCSPNYVSNQQEGLEKLINVGNALLGGGDPTMELTIETADWLYQNNDL